METGVYADGRERTWEAGVYTDCRVGKPEQLRTIRDPVFHVLFVYLPSAPGSQTVENFPGFIADSTMPDTSNCTVPQQMYRDFIQAGGSLVKQCTVYGYRFRTYF